jgi:large subunit ribosomal protein L4e
MLSIVLFTIFSLPTSKITNPDVTGIINSSVIQAVVRPANSKVTKRPWTQHKNPLVNKGVLFRLNPYAKTIRRQELREYGGISDPAFSDHFLVKQERIKAKKAKKPKTPSSAGKEFLNTLFAP